MKKLRYFLEYIAFSVLMFVFGILPVDAASATGGWIARSIGPLTGASKKARRHLQKTFPDKADDDINAIILGMWENLGRVFAEYPHLEKIARERVTLITPDNFEHFKTDWKNSILFGGHLANWEVPPVFMDIHHIKTESVYRAPNNTFIERRLQKLRSLKGLIKTHPKSASGTRSMLKSAKNGNIIGILIDQKYNEGISVPFFGIPAMTSPAFVQMGQKMNIPVIPGRIKRTQGANFEVTVKDPLVLFNEDNTPRNIEDVIQDAHKYLEEWITDAPEQWLWLHKRWGDNINTV